jgi:hypothetical protein
MLDCRIMYVKLHTINLLKRGFFFTYHQAFNHLNPTGHVMHQQFNIQQLYVLPTIYIFVLYLSENKQRLVSFTAETDRFS